MIKQISWNLKTTYLNTLEFEERHDFKRALFKIVSNNLNIGFVLDAVERLNNILEYVYKNKI